MSEEIVDIRISEKDKEEADKSINFEDFLERHKWTAGMLLLGLIFVGVGVLGLKVFSNQGPKVEILGEVEGEKWETGSGLGVRSGREEKIAVEAAGEVIKPGVYELSEGSRVNDLLIVAGGLSAEADREWVEKNINLAQKLVDGAKIYIPSKTQNTKVKSQNLELRSFQNQDKININTASEAQLDTLWGIGPATAKKIIEGRPYQKPEQLLEKKIIKSNVWEQIKGKITVF